MTENNYNNFIKDLKTGSKGLGMSFCRARQKEIEEALQKKQIMLQEINKYEDKVLCLINSAPDQTSSVKICTRQLLP